MLELSLTNACDPRGHPDHDLAPDAQPSIVLIALATLCAVRLSPGKCDIATFRMQRLADEVIVAIDHGWERNDGRPFPARDSRLTARR